MIPYLRSYFRNLRGSMIFSNEFFTQSQARWRDNEETMSSMKKYLVYILTLTILAVLMIANMIINSYSNRQVAAQTSSSSIHNQDSNVGSPTARRGRVGNPMAPLYAMSGVLGMVAIILVLRERTRIQRDRRTTNTMYTITSQFDAMRRNGFGYDEIIQRLNLSLRRSDFNGNDYELLQGLDANNHQPNIGASPEQLERLPSHVTSKEQEAKAKEEQKTCSICLGPFEEGHSVRTVACFHQFHKDCIDTWLTSNPLCPVCKVYALE